MSVVMRLATDTVHGFALPWRAACRCRLRIFEHPDRPTVVLVTAVRDCLVGPPSLAVRSSAERLRADVCRWYRLDAASLVWIVHFPSSWGHPRQFFVVDFAPDPTESCEASDPCWTEISRAHIEGLIGRALAD
jgi:hypothetical protein